MTEEPRDILAKRPCCIPRLNRRMTTLEDGWTESDRNLDANDIEWTYNLDVHLHFSDGQPWDNNTAC